MKTVTDLFRAKQKVFQILLLTAARKYEVEISKN